MNNFPTKPVRVTVIGEMEAFLEKAENYFSESFDIDACSEGNPMHDPFDCSNCESRQLSEWARSLRFYVSYALSNI